MVKRRHKGLEILHDITEAILLNLRQTIRLKYWALSTKETEREGGHDNEPKGQDVQGTDINQRMTVINYDVHVLLYTWPLFMANGERLNNVFPIWQPGRTPTTILSPL